MSDKKTIQPFITCIAVFLAACLLTAAAFCLLYRYDNKYILRAPTTQDGTADLDLFSRICLVDGWEFYPGLLLAPEDIDSGGHSPIRTHAGRYLNLSPFNEDRSAYGSATYRLQLRYDGEPRAVTLYLPEVYSACRVFIQGEPAAASGSLEPYRPLVRDLFVSFWLSGDVSLVIQTSNYSHYYSGMIFPPVLGTADAIGRLIGFRMIFYGFLCFTALAFALFSAAVWAGTKEKRDPLSLLFAVMALSFAARVCYPFLRLFGAPLIRPLYALEDGASMIGIWCALCIAFTLCGFRKPTAAPRCARRFPRLTRIIPDLARILARFALGMAVFAVVFPNFVLPYFPLWTGFYGAAITWYKLLSGLLLILTVLFGNIRRGRLFLAAGTGVYAVGLDAAALWVDRFEPLRAGWTDEYGSFALIICFAVLMILRSRALVLENERLRDHLQEEVEHQTAQISGLVDERQRLLSEFLHDLKSPAAAILSYAELVKENQILLDDTARAQLNILESKSRALSRRVLEMQKFALENPLNLRRRPVELRRFLTSFHRFLQPDIEMDGPDFNLLLPESDCYILGDEAQLRRMLENLVYNACDFTPPEGFVTLSLCLSDAPDDGRDTDAVGRIDADGLAVIQVTDTGCGIAEEALPRLFNRFYTTRQDDGGQGLGLYIVRTVAAAHGGTVTASSAPGKGSVFTVCLPLISEPSRLSCP